MCHCSRETESRLNSARIPGKSHFNLLSVLCEKASRSLLSFSCDCFAKGKGGPRSVILLHHPLPPIILALGRHLKWWEPEQCFASESSHLFCSVKVCTQWHCGLFIRVDTLTLSHIVTHRAKDKNIHRMIAALLLTDQIMHIKILTILFVLIGICR